MPLIVLLISLVSVPASDDFDPLDLYATLPVWRATGVIILTIWLWGVCVSFYERFRVNYSFSPWIGGVVLCCVVLCCV